MFDNKETKIDQILFFIYKNLEHKHALFVLSQRIFIIYMIIMFRKG